MSLLRIAKNIAFDIVPASLLRRRKVNRINRLKKQYGKRGNNKWCNICETGYEEFAPYGGSPNRMCPNCSSLERHRSLYHYLTNNSTIFSTSSPISLLHFAAEKCLHDKFVQVKDLRYETADLLNQFLPGIEVMPKHKMSITDIQFADNTFDYFLCNHVLEHVPDDRLALREIYRVLRPGGTALLKVPINHNATETLEDRSLNRIQRREHYGSQDHLRYYAAPDLLNRLSAAGFAESVSAVKTTEGMNHSYYGLDPNELLFIGVK